MEGLSCCPAAEKRVVLVHGIGHDHQQLSLMAQYLSDHGFEPHAVSLVPSDAVDGLTPLAEQLKEFVNSITPDGGKVHLVGFSMGGLVSRIYMQKFDGWMKLVSMITIATPHHGTIMAFFRNTTGVVEMRPYSKLIRSLNSELGAINRPTMKQIWTPIDHLIVPATSGRLPYGKNVMLLVPGHDRLMESERCHREVLATLQNA
jgi:triacylglycerol lipase